MTHSHADKEEVIKDPFYQPSVPYEFTINFDNDHQHTHLNDIQRIEKIEISMKDILKHYNMKYHLKLEISEPQYGQIGTLPRVHYHGVLRFETYESVVQFLLIGISKLCSIGRYQFNPLRPEYWKRYINKQQHIFKNSITLKNHRMIANIRYDDIIEPCHEGKPNEVEGAL